MRNSFIKCVVIACPLALSLPSANADLSDALQGYWRFDGDSADSSGNLRDLTLEGNAGYASSGLINNALDLPFDPLAMARRNADDQVFDFGAADFTLQIWARYDNLFGEQVLIEKFVGGAGPGWTLSKQHGANNLHFYADANAVNSSSLPIQLNTWHQIIVRRDAGYLEMFFDNALVGAGNFPIDISDTGNDLQIGQRDGLQDFRMNGDVDEVAIWSRAVTNDEITALYNNGLGFVIPDPVPEPASFGLGILGLSVVGWVKRRFA